MNQFNTEEFFLKCEKIFKFLLDNGFTVSDKYKVFTPLYDSITFKGNNVAIKITNDRKDNCIDCYILKVESGIIKTTYDDSFFGYLIKYRGYRGGLSEFNTREGDIFMQSLVKYSEAIINLTPEIVSDSTEIFQAKRKQTKKLP